MEEGLAARMTYGSGDTNTVKHYYSNKTKKKESDMACKTKKKK